jgi:hypothetical protein
MAGVDLSKLAFSAPFYGDDRDADNGFHFIHELQTAAIVYDAGAHPKIVKIWALTLQGEAKAWWKDATIWVGKDKDDVDIVAEEFEKRWPAPGQRLKSSMRRCRSLLGLR